MPTIFSTGGDELSNDAEEEEEETGDAIVEDRRKNLPSFLSVLSGREDLFCSPIGMRRRERERSGESSTYLRSNLTRSPPRSNFEEFADSFLVSQNLRRKHARRNVFVALDQTGKTKNENWG